MAVSTRSGVVWGWGGGGVGRWGGGGGGGTGGSEPPASRTIVSRLPYLYGPQPPASRPVITLYYYTFKIELCFQISTTLARPARLVISFKPFYDTFHRKYFV